MADPRSRKTNETLAANVQKLYLSPKLHEFLGYPRCSDATHYESPYSGGLQYGFVPDKVPYHERPAGVLNLDCPCMYPARYLLVYKDSGLFAIVHNCRNDYRGHVLQEPTERSKAAAKWLEENEEILQVEEKVRKRQGKKRTSVDPVQRMLKDLSGIVESERSQTVALGSLNKLSEPEVQAGQGSPETPPFQDGLGAAPLEFLSSEALVSEAPPSGVAPLEAAPSEAASLDDVPLGEPPRDDDEKEWDFVDHEDVDEPEWEWLDGAGQWLNGFIDRDSC